MANFDASLGVKTGSHLRTEERQNSSSDNNTNSLPPPSSKESSRKTTTNPPPNKNDPSLTWDVIQYLKSITSLKIFVKGVLAASDAQLAVRHGADGIIVSNHGGRQLDCAPPTLEVLPEIVDVVGGRIPVVSFDHALLHSFFLSRVHDYILNVLSSFSTLTVASVEDPTYSKLCVWVRTCAG